MSKTMNLTPVAIKYRIKKLIDRKIILGFKLNIDVNKIGYQKFKTYVQLRDYSHRKEVIDFIKNNVYLTNIDTNSGESDLELEFVLENVNQLRNIMNDLIDKFSGIIRNYDIISVVKLYKYVFFPEYF
jgi:DNA-binding Lrp family transcriptional regulator